MKKAGYTKNTLDLAKLPDTLTVAQGAFILNISEATLRGRIESGEIPAVLMSNGARKRYKLKKQDVIAWQESRKVNCQTVAEKPLAEPERDLCDVLERIAAALEAIVDVKNMGEAKL